ncbi:MAG: hypothetical protein IKL55_06110 [Clostridia bacterium]|nr:hypothetical protein [Clostridia bacterium]
MKKLKIILSVFIIILLGVGANFYLKTENVSKAKKEINNEIINSTIIEVAKDESLNEVENTLFITEEQKNTQNIIENKVISETKPVKKEVAKKTEVVIPEEKVIETVQEVSIPVVENTNKEIIENNPVKKEEKKETVKPEVPKEEPKQEPVIPETKPEVNVPVVQPPSEEYRYNEAMTQQIINIINSNPSQFMISDGYTVVVDSSIIPLTNQFTFTEERVKNKILYKAGTIKVYAQDYYVGGQYLFTECYIM